MSLPKTWLTSMLTIMMIIVKLIMILMEMRIDNYLSWLWLICWSAKLMWQQYVYYNVYLMLLLMVNEWCACFTDVFTTTLIMLSVCVKVLMVFQQPLTPIMLNFTETKLFSAAGWGFCNHVCFWLFPHIFLFSNSGVLVVFDCDYDDWTIDNGLSTIKAECIR